MDAHAAYANGQLVLRVNAPKLIAWAELALAAPLLVGGILTTTSKRRESLRNVSMMNGFLGILAILLPTALIGVCGNPDMICNSVMKPSMILTGSLVVGISIVGVAQSLRMKDDAI